MVVDCEVTLTADDERPAGVLGPGVQHVVEEADAGPYPDVLGALELGGVVGGALGGYAIVVLEDCAGGCEVGKGAAVEGEGDLDVGFVCFALLGGGAGLGGRGRHGVGSGCLLVEMELMDLEAARRGSSR